MTENKPSVDSRLLFFNGLREKFGRPLLPVPPPITDDTEAVPPRQMGLAEYIAARKRGEMTANLK
ncbi:MAG: hypothetical protein EBY32_10865 [Proteobacteria bacterium]|nr:hypothetical protein [Pseudomonadota bacterium]